MLERVEVSRAYESRQETIFHMDIHLSMAMRGWEQTTKNFCEAGRVGGAELCSQ